jgi:hypothetical protein
MRSTNHRKYPTRSYWNDYDFAAFGDSSAAVFSTRNAARFDGEFSAMDQIAPAETIMSGRAVATARAGCLQDKQNCGTTSYSVANGRMSVPLNEPGLRATLFDSVMDFLDRYDRMAAVQNFASIAERSETSTT